MFCVAGMLAGGAVLIPGCDDSSQPSRESISAPRKGGGVQDTAGEKMKPKKGAPNAEGKPAP